MSTTTSEPLAPAATRDEGVRTLVEYWKKSELTPDEAYLLGRLTFDQGPAKFLESEKYFEYAARPRPGMSLEHLAELVRANRITLDLALERAANPDDLRNLLGLKAASNGASR